jgi:hypothetical protein
VGQLIELDLNEGGSVLVEVDESGRGAVTRGRGASELVAKAGKSLEDAVGQIGPAAQAIVAELRRTADWPDEVEIEFAVKLSTDANVIIARTGGEANFRVSLKWMRPQS